MPRVEEVSFLDFAAKACELQSERYINVRTYKSEATYNCMYVALTSQQLDRLDDARCVSDTLAGDIESAAVGD